MSDRGFHQRLKLASILLLIIPLGLLVKFGISGPLENWCHRYGAAILYEVFWIQTVSFGTSAVGFRDMRFTIYDIRCTMYDL